MKKELYENYLLVRYMYMTMEQVNKLDDHEKQWYIKKIKEYLNAI